MRFGLLGTLVVDDGGAERVVPSGKQRALLALLLLRARETVSSDRLIDVLWGDELPANPANALQARVSQLRKALGAAGRDIVVQQGAGYAVAVADADIDVRRFERLAGRGRQLLAEQRWDEAATALRDALSLWRGDALADFPDELWATAERSRLGELRLATLEDRVDVDLALGRHRAVVGELEPLVSANPLRERLRAQLMTALYRSGRQADALRVYDEGRRELADDLGLDPSPQLQDLHAAILTQADTLAPPERTATPGDNLPAATTRLIGVDRAVEQIAALTRSARLVTVTGPGGVGKTRTAIEAARTLLPAHPGGVWLVELAALTGRDDIVVAISHVLGLAGGPGDLAGVSADLDARLTAALSHRPVLLILDNAEHLVDEVATLVAGLLARSSAVRLLITSREPLGVSGEVVWSLPSLPLPPADTVDAATAAPYASVALFLDRARAAAPAFTLDDHIVADVVTIVRRLDGIPLAIELAAARLRVLGVGELAARLDQRFRLLSRSGRDVLPRHRTLRGLLDWSWDLLDDHGRRAWIALAAFADAFTIDDAGAVLRGDDEDPLDLLAGLVDRSIVTVDTSSSPTRYRMLETIREYGRARSADITGSDAAAQRHIRWLVDAVDAAATTGTARWGVDVDRQHALLDDARQVMASARGHDDHETVARVAGGLGWLWWLRGMRAEGLRWLSVGLAGGASDGRAAMWAGFLVLDDPGGGDGSAWARAGAEAPGDVDRGIGETFLALHLARSGDIAAADAALDAARRRLAPHGGWPLATTFLVAGAFAAAGARHGEAAAACERADELFAAADAWWGRLFCGDILATVAEAHGDYAAADRHLDRVLRLSRHHHAAETEASTLARLGNLAVLAGDDATAAARHTDALELAQRLGSAAVEAFARNGMGLAARRRGDLATAERQHSRALALYEELDNPAGSAFALAGLGFVAELRGDPDAAGDRHLRGLRLAQPYGDARAVALALEGLAGAAVVGGRARNAVMLLACADRLRREAGAPLPGAERFDVERVRSHASASLDDAAFDGAWRAGLSLPVADATHL